MGKRSEFRRRPRDFYPTPYAAVIPLLPHLGPFSTYAEPCAGDGAIIRHLASYCRCVSASDINPQASDILKADALTIRAPVADCFITNPPWDRKIVHPLIDHLRQLEVRYSSRVKINRIIRRFTCSRSLVHPLCEGILCLFCFVIYILWQNILCPLFDHFADVVTEIIATPF